MYYSCLEYECSKNKSQLYSCFKQEQGIFWASRWARSSMANSTCMLHFILTAICEGRVHHHPHPTDEQKVDITPDSWNASLPVWIKPDWASAFVCRAHDLPTVLYCHWKSVAAVITVKRILVSSKRNGGARRVFVLEILCKLVLL